MTEILTVYFPANYSATDQYEFEKSLKKFVAVLEENAPAHTGCTGGWVIGEIPLLGTSNKAKAYVACFGWQSMEAHLAFRETQSFKDNEHLLSRAKDLEHVQLVHISGTLVNRRDGDIV